MLSGLEVDTSLKGTPGLLILLSSNFFWLRHEYYSKLKGKEVFLVYEPVVIKAMCKAKNVLISLNPGSLIINSEDEKLLDLGACISLEYFWFKGSKITWRVGKLPDFLKEEAIKAGFIPNEGVDVIELSAFNGESYVKMPWHPASFALEDGLPCRGFSDVGGLELAKCGSSSLLTMSSSKNQVYIGKIEEPWRYLPLLAYISSR